MRIQRSLALLLALVAACAPAPEEELLEEAELASEPDSEQALWRWWPCGTTATLLADLRPGRMSSRPRELTRAAGTLFFTAEDGVHGRELWTSSGTHGPGTWLVKDLRPGSATSNPRRLTEARGRLFFTAEDGVHGRELWVSDGTAAGTVMVKDILPGPVGSSPEHLLAFGGVLYFAANDGVHGTELWRSDGTAEGTYLVEDLYPGEDSSTPGRPGSSSPRRLTRAGGALYFVANGEDTTHVWRSRGVPGATAIFSAPEDHFLFSLTAVGPRLFFLVDGGEGETSLWRSWGSTARHLRSFPGLSPHGLTALGRRLFFSAGAGKAGRPGDPEGEELWVSDGTSAGTEQVRDLRPGQEGSAPGSLAAVRGRLYFAADGGLHGRELWRSNGTAWGTTQVRDLEPSVEGSAPRELTSILGLLFFSAETEGRGREPWVSLGTGAGTVPLTELAPGAASSNPRGFLLSGWDIFFTATDGTRGEELWALPLFPGGRCHGRALE